MVGLQVSHDFASCSVYQYDSSRNKTESRLALIKRYALIFFEVYFLIRPFDWIFIISVIKEQKIKFTKPYFALVIFIILISLIDLNSAVLLLFGFLVIVVCGAIYTDRKELIHAQICAARLIAWTLVVDVALNLGLGLDVKTAIGLPNENYEADYARYSGIFSESAVYGPVLFLLLFSLTVDRGIVKSRYKEILILASTGFLTLSVVSGLLSLALMSLIFLSLPWKGKGRVLLWTLLAFVAVGAAATDIPIVQSATKAGARLSEFVAYLTGGGSVVVDGSATDRVGSLFSGIRYRGASEVLGTWAPSGYRSIAGVLLQTFDLRGVLIFSSACVASFLWAGRFGLMWLSVVFFLPNQFLTTAITYLSLFALRHAYEGNKNFLKANRV